jgi:hypothetical protein
MLIMGSADHKPYHTTLKALLKQGGLIRPLSEHGAGAGAGAGAGVGAGAGAGAGVDGYPSDQNIYAEMEVGMGYASNPNHNSNIYTEMEVGMKEAPNEDVLKEVRQLAAVQGEVLEREEEEMDRIRSERRSTLESRRKRSLDSNEAWTPPTTPRDLSQPLSMDEIKAEYVAEGEQLYVESFLARFLHSRVPLDPTMLLGLKPTHM